MFTAIFNTHRSAGVLSKLRTLPQTLGDAVDYAVACRLKHAATEAEAFHPRRRAA